MKHLKLYEVFGRAFKPDGYAMASDAAKLYDLAVTYDISFESIIKLVNNADLKKRLIRVNDELGEPKFEKGDIVKVLSGRYEGNTGKVTKSQDVADWLRSDKPTIGYWVGELNPEEVESIELAKNWSEVPSSSLKYPDELELVKKADEKN